MKFRHVLITPLLALLALIPLSSCQKDDKEAARFPRADADTFARKFEQQVHFQLDNGIAVYVQRDSTFDDVAVEILYRAGFVHEPAGKPQVSHIAEHAVVFSPTDSYEANEVVDHFAVNSRINAEAVGNFVHFDFVVASDKLEELLKITSEQLTSARFTDEVREEQAKKAGKEIPLVVGSDRGSLSKYAFIALCQAIQHGATNVPIQQANFDVTIEDLAEFHSTYYRPEDMVIVIVGNVSAEHARSLIEENFADIPGKPEPPRYDITISSDMSVKWDIEASVVYLVYPGPFEDLRTRAALVAFGSYLNQVISHDPQAPVLTQSTYTTNPTYSLDGLPFFVFAQVAKYKSMPEVREWVAALTDQAVTTLDEQDFRRLITALKNVVNSSFLESHKFDYRIDNARVIGQQALTTGILHYLCDGLSREEYNQLLDSITFEEMQTYLQTYLSPERRHVVTISGS